MELPESLLAIPHRRSVPFARLTTLGLGGHCKWLFEPTSEEETINFVKTCRLHSLNYRILGGGSNLLVLSDITVPVMRLCFPPKLRVTKNGFSANASYGHIALTKDVADLGLSGIEWACGIPGSFGGAIRMNAGAHGGEWGQVIDSVRYVTPEGELMEKKPDNGDFTYRSSFLVEGDIILGACVELAKSDSHIIYKTMDEYRQTRKKSQPAGRSAGCVFKNPCGKSAGHLIDSAGLKGTCVGDAKVSAVHANFILNTGFATPNDYWNLVHLVRSKVLEVHGIELELEVEVWSEH